MLACCLPAVHAALRPGDDLVVVDSASRGTQTGQVARAAGAFTIRCERPGLSRARNAGVAASTGEVIAFTDDDCRPQPGWLDALVAAFADPAVGFALGRVEGEGDGAPMSVSGPEPGAARVVGLRDDVTLLGHGANFAVRRSAWAPLGGFDPLLGAGGRFRAAEDKDALWRLQRAGWLGQVVPSAVVVHSQWRNRRAAARLVRGYGLGEGARAAKLARFDRTAGRELLRAQLLDHGLAQAVRDLRAGYKTGVVLSLLRTAGVATGAVRGRRHPVRGGLFVDDLAVDDR